MRVILFLGVAAAITAGVAFYLLLFADLRPAPHSQISEPVNTTQPELVEPAVFSGEGTLATLIDLGMAVECQISYIDPELTEPVQGTYFLSDGRIRGDFQLTVPELGGDIVSSVISNDTMFYSWSRIAGQTYGVMASLDTVEQADAESLREPVPRTATVSYQCERWSPIDAVVFEPPSDVLFQDVLSIQAAGMEYGTIYEEGEF
jgi:hypothetical protein